MYHVYLTAGGTHRQGLFRSLNLKSLHLPCLSSSSKPSQLISRKLRTCTSVLCTRPAHVGPHMCGPSTSRPRKSQPSGSLQECAYCSVTSNSCTLLYIWQVHVYLSPYVMVTHFISSCELHNYGSQKP